MDCKKVNDIVVNKLYKGHAVLKSNNRKKETVDVVAKNIGANCFGGTLDRSKLYVFAPKNKKGKNYAYSDFIFADVLYCKKCGWKLRSVKAKRVATNNPKFTYRYYRYYQYSKNIINDLEKIPKCTLKIVNAQKLEI